MWDTIKSGAIAVDQNLVARVLKEEYQSKPSCRMAARLAAGATVTDIVDGNDSGKRGGGVTSWLDFFNEVALMLCMGMTRGQIVLYYCALIVAALYVMNEVKAKIPDSLWKKCTFCTGPKGAQKCRPGTPEECKRMGSWIELILGLVIAGVALGIVRFLFKSILKLQVYKLEALMFETVVRTVA